MVLDETVTFTIWHHLEDTNSGTNETVGRQACYIDGTSWQVYLL